MTPEKVEKLKEASFPGQTGFTNSFLCMLEPSRSVIFQLYSDAGRGAAGWDDTGESRETQGGILPGQTGFTTVSCVCWNHHVL